MDINRTMQHKPRAVRKLLYSYSSEESKESSKNLEAFRFPPPPRLPLPHFSPPPFAGASDVDTSDSQSDPNTKIHKTKHLQKLRIPPGRMYSYRGYQSDGSPARMLPPIGVFWDIENCQIPRGKSAVAVAQTIRNRFFDGYREAEFVVVCDVRKENPQVIQELNDAQVNLIHVGATSKNAADEKLRHSMRRFADIHGFPAAVILISGDVNFAPDLCDLRHRKKIHIILLHNERSSESLILCAHEHYIFSKLVEALPLRGTKTGNEAVEVIIRNLPLGCDSKKVKRKLKTLSDNCGGRVGHVSESTATIRFPSIDFAKRAQKRLDGELVFGNQISVGFPQRIGSRKDSLPSGQRDGMVSLEMPHVAVLSSNIGGQLGTGVVATALYPQNSSGTWQTCGNIELQNGTRGFGNNQKPKGNNSLQSKGGRSVLGNKNEVNVRENTSGWVSQSLPTTYNDYASNWDSQSGGMIPRHLNGSFDSEGTDRVEAILKRSRIASPKPSRCSLDSLKYSGRNSSSINVGRKCRTPSPYTAAGISAPNQSSAFARKVTPYQMEISDNDKYFNPISSASSSSQASNPVELHVSNLDQDIEPNLMKKILMSIFGEHVMVLHVSVYMQSDGNFAATLKVPSLQDAQYAISQLHRRKVGFKRISISYANSSHPHNPQFIRWQIVSLLQEVPGYKLPLFKFLELFESRYLTTVSVSDLCKLRDVCIITNENNGRMVSLNPDHRNTPSPNLVSCQDIDLYCSLHYKGIQCSNKGWAELEAALLPNIREPLTKFSSNVHSLLTSHNNILPLASFCDCYDEQCGKLTVDESGVPLEHLITCVNKVEIAISNGIKYLKPAPLQCHSDDKLEDVCKSVSPSLANQVNQFGRELVDLLKTQPRCQLMFNRFIPAYHHHFGRQCRVADYGFTKLIELLDALPNVIRVIGEGKKRIVTLSFHAQIRRFTSDLLRVLKAQPFKKMNLTELPQLFERILGRPFDPVDYGLCELNDLVDQLSENTVVVSRSAGNISLSISKHEQTSEEIELTKVFAKEVVELLSHASQCSILFNKFIPAYHHHYGHQCRVADFGFSKLIELFEAIPDVVKLDENSDGERRVSLTCELKLKVLNDQISKLASARYPPGLPLKSLSAAFLWQYGYTLKPENYKTNSLEELISIITTVKIENLDCGPTLIPVDEAQVKQLSAQIHHLLMNSDEGKMPLSKLQAAFSKCYEHHLTSEQLLSYMGDTIKIEDHNGGEKVVLLNHLNQFAREIYQILLKRNGWKLPVKALQIAYFQTYFVPIQPELYGFTNLSALLCAISHTVTIRGKGVKRVVALNRDLINGSNLGISPTRNASGNITSNDSVFNLGDFVNGSPKKSTESVWSNGCHLEGYNNQVPVVILPEMSPPPANIMDKTALISPCKTLLSAGGHPLLYTVPISNVIPPDPSELPIPEMYLSPKLDKIKEEDSCRKCPVDDQPMNQSESSISDTKSQVNLKEHENVTPSTPVESANKRKLRLAAQFQTPIDFL